MCLLRFWFYVLDWLPLCCLKSLLFLKVFPHIAQLNYVTSALWLCVTNYFLCLRYIFFGSISTLFTINLVRFWSDVYQEFWSYVSCWYFLFGWKFPHVSQLIFSMVLFHVHCLCHISAHVFAQIFSSLCATLDIYYLCE